MDGFFSNYVRDIFLVAGLIIGIIQLQIELAKTGKRWWRKSAVQGEGKQKRFDQRAALVRANKRAALARANKLQWELRTQRTHDG